MKNLYVCCKIYAVMFDMTMTHDKIDVKKSYYFQIMC